MAPTRGPPTPRTSPPEGLPTREPIRDEHARDLVRSSLVLTPSGAHAMWARQAKASGVARRWLRGGGAEAVVGAAIGVRPLPPGQALTVGGVHDVVGVEDLRQLLAAGRRAGMAVRAAGARQWGASRSPEAGSVRPKV